MRLIVCLLALCLLTGCDKQKQGEPQAPPAQQVTGKTVDRTHRGETAPAVIFYGPDGSDVTIAKFKGKPVLVNLWASWCAPCIKELPTLQKLNEGHMADVALVVIAVSQDAGPKESVEAFLKGKDIASFASYRDPDMKLTDALAIQVMPTTVLYDANGKEVWRYIGDLDWTGAEATALLGEAGVKS